MKYSFKFPLSAFAISSENRVDPENGIIHGVSLIAAGGAKGHKVLIDATSLAQLLSLAKKFKNGLPIKFNIDTQDHNEGKGMNCGRMPADSMKLEDGRITGDVHLQKKAPCFDYLIELAQTQPENFGLSIEANGAPEEKDGMLIARFSELTAAAFVDMPAAQVKGLFSFKAEANDPKPKTKSNDDTDDMDLAQMTELIKTAVGEAVKPMSTALDTLKTDVTQMKEDFKMKKGDDASEDDVAKAPDDEMKAAGCVDGDTMPVKQSKLGKYRKLLSQPLTGATLIQFLAKAGGNGQIVGASVGTGDGKTGDKDPIIAFKKAVDTLMEAGVKEGAAVQAVIAKQPEIYKAYCLAKDEAIKANTYKPIRFGRAAA